MMFTVDRLNVYYGESHVIRSASFALGEGETVAFMGRNGMGKTTLLKSLIGIIPLRSGSIDLSGKDLSRIKTGFVWIATGQGAPIDFYLDDIQYE